MHWSDEEAAAWQRAIHPTARAVASMQPLSDALHAGGRHGDALLTLLLPWPPSNNTYYRHVGHRILLSAAGRTYRRLVGEACLLQRPQGQLWPFAGRLAVELVCRPPDRRVRDLDNLFKAVGDSLQAAGVYHNDSQIDELRLVRSRPTPGGTLAVTITPREATP